MVEDSICGMIVEEKDELLNDTVNDTNLKSLTITIVLHHVHCDKF